MIEVALIGLASGIGAVCRYSLSNLNVLFKKMGFPVGTYFVNIIGSLLIGYFFGKFGNQAESYKIFATGFCGGLTTFSTYNFELFDLLEKHRYRLFTEYFILSYGLGFIAVIIGLILAQHF